MCKCARGTWRAHSPQQQVCGHRRQHHKLNQTSCIEFKTTFSLLSQISLYWLCSGNYILSDVHFLCAYGSRVWNEPVYYIYLRFYSLFVLRPTLFQLFPFFERNFPGISAEFSVRFLSFFRPRGACSQPSSAPCLFLRRSRLWDVFTSHSRFLQTCGYRR